MTTEWQEAYGAFVVFLDVYWHVVDTALHDALAPSQAAETVS